MKTTISCTAACIPLLALFPALTHADSAQIVGDIVVDGISFTSDSSVQTKANAWLKTDPAAPGSISYMPGNVGIGTLEPSSKLDVQGTISATTFLGSGAGVTGIPAAPHDHGSSYWKMTGNAETVPGTSFIGTTDNTALEIRAANTCAIRIIPTTTSPNIALGYFRNLTGGGAAGATVSGGGLAARVNTASSFYSTVGGGVASTAGGNSSTVGGGSDNTAMGDFSTVRGGNANAASGNRSTIAGGHNSTAVGLSSTVAGGQSNHSNGNNSTIGGGYNNASVGAFSAVGGGDYNIAGGSHSSVGGGYGNAASGTYSWTGGRQANAYTTAPVGASHGAFIWADSNFVGGDTGQEFNSIANDEFAVRARGGVRLVTAVDGSGVPTRTFAINSAGDVIIDPAGDVNFGSTTRQMLNLWGTAYAIGVQDYTTYFRSNSDFSWYRNGTYSDKAGNPGGGTTLMSLTSGGLTVNGTPVSASDRNKKENFAEVEAQQILVKVADLPVQQWNYRDDGSKVAHIGPMAQDFKASFINIGPDDTHIATVDADGIALASIKALKAENDALKTRLKRLEALWSAR